MSRERWLKGVASSLVPREAFSLAQEPHDFAGESWQGQVEVT